MTSRLQQESARCLSCKNPTCKQACPVTNDIPTFFKLVKAGQFTEAVNTVGHPFGEICGYVCPQDKQCQGGCVLSRSGRELNIGEVEKELFRQFPYEVTRRGNALIKHRIAVIGGGVCGVTFAVKAYEEGADVTIFERDELLSTLKTIPNFRLPVEAIARVEKVIEGKIKVVKQDVTRGDLVRLKADYDAVLIATGACVKYGLGIDGEEFAIDYKECLKDNYKRGKVVIVGGGNSAMDCARLAKSEGCDALVAYRRERGDMPAFEKEVEAAIYENVRFEFNVAPVRLIKTQDGLTLVLAKTVSQGRGRLEITNDTFEIHCDSVIAAIGSRFDNSILNGEVSKAEAYNLYDNVYIGGDAFKGKLVADAVADGKKLAEILIENARKLCSSTK